MLDNRVKEGGLGLGVRSGGAVGQEVKAKTTHFQSSRE